MKSTLKRFLSLVLCMCMVMALLPNVTMTAFAATRGTVTGLTDENIGLSFEGDADDAWSAYGTSITGAATSTGGTCSDTSHSSTLTITNKKSTTATLSFDYSIEQNSGKIQVDGTAVSSGASFTKELAANEAVKVYIESGSTSAATKITLTNVVLVSNVNATATFVPAENGTYTVDGKLITEEYSNTQSSMTAYQVVATPADGYQFMGWYDVSNEKYISTSAKAALNIEMTALSQRGSQVKRRPCLKPAASGLTIWAMRFPMHRQTASPRSPWLRMAPSAVLIPFRRESRC